MKTTLILTLFSAAFTLTAQAQSSADLSCKAQAKEVAVQTYSTCMTQARNGQIEQIRKNYKDELAAVKAKYDKELKSLGSPQENSSKAKPSKAAKNKKSSPVETAMVTDAPKATKGVARKLPTRSLTKEVPSSQEPLTAVQDSQLAQFEKEATTASSIEVIELPDPEKEQVEEYSY